jgi:UDP-GlcNAc:undecaprenyl-phosphate GlcNAc-1-phosphate transferase
MGFTHRKAVILLYAITLTLGLLALATVCFRDLNQALFLSAVGIASYIGVKKLGYSEIQFLRNGTLLPLFDLPLLSRRMLKVFLDVGSITLAYYLAFSLRFEGSLDPAIKHYYLTTLPLVLVVKVVVFYLTGLYQGVWRYMSVDQFLRILKAVFLGGLTAALALWAIPPWGVKSWSVLLIDFNLLFFLIGATRSSFRVLEHLHLSNHNGGRKILLYGVGKDSVHALHELIANPRLQLAPVGFIDDNPRNQGVQIDGFPVLGTLDTLETLLRSQAVSEIILSQEHLPQEKMDRLSAICTPRQIPIRRFQTHLVEVSPSPRLAR